MTIVEMSVFRVFYQNLIGTRIQKQIALEVFWSLGERCIVIIKITSNLIINNVIIKITSNAIIEITRNAIIEITSNAIIMITSNVIIKMTSNLIINNVIIDITSNVIIKITSKAIIKITSRAIIMITSIARRPSSDSNFRRSILIQPHAWHTQYPLWHCNKKCRDRYLK